MKLYLILLFPTLFLTARLQAQWDTLVFPDTTYKFVKIVAADGDAMPTFFAGFRGFAQVYATKIWPKVGWLRASSGYGLLEKDFFYGADGFINSVSLRKQSETSLQVGKIVPLDPTHYKKYMVNISDVPLVIVPGVHFGYKHKEYQDMAIISVFGPTNIDLYYMNNIVVEEYFGGAGLTIRKGVILTDLSTDKFNKGFPELLSYSAKWVNWMIYADIIYEKAIRYTITPGPDNVTQWDEQKYSRFPSVGWRLCGDVNWNYSKGKTSRNFVSISGHFGIQNTEIAFMNEPIRERGFAIIATGGIFYSRRFRNYNERSARVVKPVAPVYRNQ